MLQSEPEEVIYKEAPGWNAITECFEKRYPDQKIPAHFGCYASYKPDEMGPLDGISVYNGGDYFHFVTYGLSELYEKQNGNPERSGYRFELTLKLKKRRAGKSCSGGSSYMQPASDDCGHHGQQRTSVHARAVSGDGAAERSGCRIEICDHRIYHQGGRHWNGGISLRQGTAGAADRRKSGRNRADEEQDDDACAAGRDFKRRFD